MTIDEYMKSIDDVGLDRTWLEMVKKCQNTPEIKDGVLSVSNFGELYEIGLAHVNKESKKSLGKYFTPSDVATLMAKWLCNLSGENICDVCCGVGNLVLAYLKHIGRDKARELIKSGSLWLYDKDELALWICVNTIGILYGDDIVGYIHSCPGDFLDSEVRLPENSKVVSNPPYAKVEQIPDNWNKTDVVSETKELYAAIMEKILSEPGVSGTVLLTPQNYLGREKFKSLRKLLGSGYTGMAIPFDNKPSWIFNGKKHTGDEVVRSGFVVPFDNTPGQLFNGKKHGVFNSNQQNQVRPAILVTDNRKWGTGIQVAGMIRFRNGERNKVLTPEFLSKFVGNTPQRTNGDRYAKCFPQLEPLLLAWRTKSIGERFRDFVCDDGEYKLNFVTTCRYNTVAYVSDLFRSGKRTLGFKDSDTRDLAYCWLNSSFCYWHWRLYDGEITYQQGMLDEMPTFIGKLTSDARTTLIGIAKEMQGIEGQNIVRKKNSGKMMESVKFPDEYRTKINNILLLELGVECDGHEFDIIHAHSLVGDNGLVGG